MKKNITHISTMMFAIMFMMINIANANTPAAATAAATADSARHTLSSAYVIGVFASYNMRDAYRKFDGFDSYVPAEKSSPFMFGGMIGRRSPMNNQRLRTQIALEGGGGKVKDLEFSTELNGNFENVHLHTRYLTGGVTTDLHILFPDARQTVFISAGAGVHLTSYQTIFRDDDGGKLEAYATGASHATLSPSANVGVGVEQKNSDRHGMTLGYNFRFWQSSRHIETGVLFPAGVLYREFFYSHSIYLQILLPGLERGGRFK